MKSSRFSWIPILVATVIAVGSGVIGVAWSSSSGPFRPLPTQSIFRLRSELPFGDIAARQLLEEMMFLDAEIGLLLPLKRSPLPVQVNLFATRESYDQFLLEKVPSAAGRTAIFVDDNEGGQIYICSHPGLLQDVRHECTHAILHQSLEEIPLWLDEGLAEYFEVSSDQRQDGNPYLAVLKQELRAGYRIDLTELERVTHVDDLTSTHYRDAWGWVHFLMHGPESVRQELRNYILELATKGAAVGPLSERIRASTPDMDVLLVNHLLTW